MTETGFKTLTFQEFRQLGISRMEPKPKVVFVNRRKAFKPPEDLLRSYEDLMRRYEGHAKQKQFALRYDFARDRAGNIILDGRTGQPMWVSKYELRYRNKLLNDRRSMREMRNLSEKSREGAVYMVSDRDRPDADIIVDICTQMIGGEVW